MRRLRLAFTLIELLVVIAIIAILAAILFPVFARAKEAAKGSACLLQMRQLGAAFALYLQDNDQRMPDRRDLKAVGYRPWTSWPPSDPRAGWAQETLAVYTKSSEVWDCPGSKARFGGLPQVEQATLLGRTNLWMWRFDRLDDPVPLDNFWGKSEEQAVEDLRVAGNPQAGSPDSPADVELIVDPYFPKTIATVPADLKGKSAHPVGRNRLFLDLHAKKLVDRRLD